MVFPNLPAHSNAASLTFDDIVGRTDDVSVMETIFSLKIEKKIMQQYRNNVLLKRAHFCLFDLARIGNID